MTRVLEALGVHPSVASSTFLSILSAVSTAVGIAYYSWKTGRERERERERERGVIKTCKGIHELCSIKIHRGFGHIDILCRRMEVTRYSLLEKITCLLVERFLKIFAVSCEIVPGQAS